MRNSARIARSVEDHFRAGEKRAELVFDGGYTDYSWFQQLTEEGVNFVTRLKDNAAYIVVERRAATGAGVTRTKSSCCYRNVPKARS